MADQARKDFQAVALTLDGRVAGLPQAEKDAIERIAQKHKEQEEQLKQEQAQRRENDVAVERAKLMAGRSTFELHPPGVGQNENYQQLSARMEIQAEKNVDFRNEQALKKLEDEKNKEVERRVEQSEKQQAERDAARSCAEELAKAAERARELQARARGGHDRER